MVFSLFVNFVKGTQAQTGIIGFVRADFLEDAAIKLGLTQLVPDDGDYTNDGNDFLVPGVEACVVFSKMDEILTPKQLVDAAKKIGSARY